jgi:hypothetical protein
VATLVLVLVVVLVLEKAVVTDMDATNRCVFPKRKSSVPRKSREKTPKIEDEDDDEYEDD